MLDSFLTFINQLRLDLQAERTLLTVSGGVDSVVMANLFHRAGFSAALVHCNFGLRGEESVQDEVFVRELAAKYNFPFFVQHFDAKSFAKENKISTQMAAREVRYKWFEEIRKEKSFDRIATAHHANDALETVLLNIARGTGIAGLHGIAPIKTALIRPMLFASKEEILVYAMNNGILWREDRSNNSLDYKRNVVRQKIVPVLKELNPSIENTFKQSSEKIRAADSLLTSFLEEWKESFLNASAEEIKIPIRVLKDSKEPAYRLWYLLNDYGFSFAQSTGIAESLNSVSGRVFYSESHELLKDRDDLILRLKHVKLMAEEIIIPGKEGKYGFKNGYLQIGEDKSENLLSAVKDQMMIWVDEDKISFPLTVRKWLHGDILYPFGMKGRRKKVSDLLVDLKLSLFQKEEIALLTDAQGNIIWVIGIRGDDRWRVTSETKHILKISHEK